MRKSHLSLLTVAMVIASILFAGCTSPNQTSQGPSQVASTNASTSSTTTTLTSSAATASPTVVPSPSASATPATPTPAPSASGKIATSIQFARDPTVVKGERLGINVLVSGIRICSDGAVTVSGVVGTVSSGGSGEECLYTAYFDTSSLNPGTYNVILNFAGDSTHQPSQSTSKITITA